MKLMSCILFDRFTCNDLDVLKHNITDEKYYEELRVLEIRSVTKQLWVNIVPLDKDYFVCFYLINT